MTYGVDQCRCCGAPIKPEFPEQLNEYFATLKLHPPLMTEAQWRRAGYLAPPTRRQMWRPQTGCCWECAEIQIRRKTKPVKKMAMVVAGASVVFSLVFLLTLYLTK